MKVRYASYFFIVFLMVVSVSSCQNRPKEVLSRKQMEKVMYDVYVAEATIENDYSLFNTPEKKEAYIQEVFAIHRITQSQWDSSLSWYSDRIDLYLKMNDSVKARLQRQRSDIDLLLTQQRSTQFTDPALLSASYIPKTYLFFNPSVRNGFRFQLDSMEIEDQIEDEHFSFTFSVVGIPPGFQSRFFSLLSLQYADTTFYKWQDIDENKTYSIKASKFIENDTLKQIQGFVNLQDTTARASQISLYNIFLGNQSNAKDTLSLQGDELLKERAKRKLQKSIKRTDNDSL